METGDPSSPFLRLAAVVALVAANAFFVAAEFALVGARKTKLDEMEQAGSRRAGMARRAITHLDRYISATQLGITLASLALGWIGKPALATLVEGAFSALPAPLSRIATQSVAIAVAFAIITLLHIVLGELVPKAVALLYPERVSEWVTPPLLGFTWVMAAPIAVLNGLANGLLRLLRVKPPGTHERLHSPEEIRMLVEQSQEGGRLTRGDARLLEGVFEFSEKSAEEVMTPRTEMVAMDADDSVEASADVVARAGRSRYPVYRESLDDIVGVVHAKDILRALRDQSGLDPARNHAVPALRAGHARGGGRARGHEAAQGPSRRGARRIRGHRGARDDGRPARGDRRPDLRRVRPAGRGARPDARLLDGGCRSPSSTPRTTRSWMTPTTPPSADMSLGNWAGYPVQVTGWRCSLHL
jgi:CBS domain containing-hemolysin-like protein